MRKLLAVQHSAPTTVITYTGSGTEADPYIYTVSVITLADPPATTTVL